MVVQGTRIDKSRGGGVMSEALWKMIRNALQVEVRSISAKVIKDNPAVNWYEKNQFKVDCVNDDHFVMRFLY